MEKMKFSYRQLWKLLIDNDMKKKDLMDKAHITSTTMAKMGKEEAVSMEVLGRICRTFNCGIGEIVEIYFPEGSKED